jgi:hypothetical protein
MKCAVLWIREKPNDVESALNEWLAQHPKIDIKAVSQQPQFCYTIFYEEK